LVAPETIDFMVFALMVGGLALRILVKSGAGAGVLLAISVPFEREEYACGPSM
jgi:uncharacterized ion transporter superfamily protein YfcC